MDRTAIDPQNLPNVKLKALWALMMLENNTENRFTSSQLANFLVEDHGINTSRQAIEYALQSDRTCAHKNKSGYKIMAQGRDQVAQHYKDSGGIIMVESGKPYSAKNVELKKVFNTLQGTLSVSDPYLDVETLDTLVKNVSKRANVRFLTQHISDRPPGIVSRHLEQIRKEGYQIEVRVYSNSNLHDRYLMDNSVFWLSGNSLNGLGNKESFLVRLGEDVRQSMMTTFNQRWKVSTKI